MLENEVVVGLDGSAAAQAALQCAARYARFTYTDVRVIHVPTCSVGASIAWSAGVPGVEGFFSPEPDNLQRRALQHVFEAIRPEPGWELEYRDGCPGPVLVTQSQDAQLLIVGTRKRACLAGLLSGSTSHFCLTHATCPVVAIHEPEADGGYASVQNGLRSRKRWRHAGSWTATSPQSYSDPIARFLTPAAPAVVTSPVQRPRPPTVQLLEPLCTMIRSPAITTGEVSIPPIVSRWHGPDAAVSNLAELLAAT